MKFSIKIVAFALAFSAIAVSCNKEYFNPSTASEDQIVKDVDGLVALASGLQYRWTVGRQSPGYTVPTANGCSTRELVVLNAGNADEGFLAVGGNSLSGSNAVVTNIWTQCNLTKASADIILNNLGIVGDPVLKSGLTCYAAIFKALALGTMAQFFEQVPIEVREGANFSTREQALGQAVLALENARTLATANPPSNDLGGKTPAGLDLVNTVNALIARYQLMGGNYQGALANALLVDLTKKSEFRYDEVTRNPVFDVAFGNINVVQPTDSALGLPAAIAPAIADKRVLFYLKSKTPSGTGVYSGKGFWTANSSPVPVYLPGEMLLIQAECQANLNGDALTPLNAVLTKTTDAFGIGAGLPAYSGATDKASLLQEIFRNRCIELFMSGMKMEDCRRMGRPAPSIDNGTLINASERNRVWYPYPNTERDNNPNTPANPPI